MTLGPIAIDMYLPSLPSIGAEFGVSPAVTQSTVSAYLAGVAVGQLFFGPASDRVGRRPPVLFGVSVFILAAVGCALAASASQLIGLRFVQALGSCAGLVVARAVIRDRLDHTETARMLSLMMLIQGGAPLFAPLIGGVLMGIGGWRLIFWVIAGLGAVVGAAAFFRLKETRSAATAAQARSEHPIAAYGSLFRQRRLVGYTLANALNGATLFAYISSSPALLIGVYGVAPASFGWFFAINGIGLVAANQVNRWLLKRWTPDEVLGPASTAGVVAALLLLAAAVTGIGGPWSVLPALFLVVSTYGLLQSNTVAGGLDVDPLRAGSVSALMGSASFAAGAAAAWIAGALQDGTARPLALVMAVALVGSALSLRWLAWPRPQASS